MAHDFVQEQCSRDLWMRSRCPHKIWVDEWTRTCQFTRCQTPTFRQLEVLSQNRTAKQDRGDFSSFLTNLPRVGDGQDTVEEGRSHSRNQTSKGALQNKCSQVPPAPNAEGYHMGPQSQRGQVWGQADIIMDLPKITVSATHPLPVPLYPMGSDNILRKE